MLVVIISFSMKNALNAKKKITALWNIAVYPKLSNTTWIIQTAVRIIMRQNKLITTVMCRAGSILLWGCLLLSVIDGKLILDGEISPSITSVFILLILNSNVNPVKKVLRIELYL